MLNPFHASLDPDTRTLTLSGVIDDENLSDLASAVSEALTVLPCGVVLDLTNVEQLPIDAVFVLIMAHEMHRETPMQLRARTGSPAAFVLARTGYHLEGAQPQVHEP